MTGQELRAIRTQYGWSQRQVGQATHYTYSAIGQYERGQHPVPADLAAWAQAIPPRPQSRAYPQTAGGLRAYLRNKQMRVVELAAFVGAGETSVVRWLTGIHAVPPSIRA